MATIKKIEAEGKELTLRASALTPHLYRIIFGRDIIKDMYTLKEALTKADGRTTEEKNLTLLNNVSFEMFDKATYIMCMQGDEATRHKPPEEWQPFEDWLDSFDSITSLYQLLPATLEVWFKNEQTTSIPKKK